MNDIIEARGVHNGKKLHKKAAAPQRRALLSPSKTLSRCRLGAASSLCVFSLKSLASSSTGRASGFSPSPFPKGAGLTPPSATDEGGKQGGRKHRGVQALQAQHTDNVFDGQESAGVKIIFYLIGTCFFNLSIRGVSYQIKKDGSLCLRIKEPSSLFT